MNQRPPREPVRQVVLSLARLAVEDRRTTHALPKADIFTRHRQPRCRNLPRARELESIGACLARRGGLLPRPWMRP